jgi:hypothetical protein
MITKTLTTLITTAYLALQPVEPVAECTEHSAAICEVIVDMDKSRELWLYGQEDTLRYNCQRIVAEALHVGVKPEHAVSIARFESSFNPYVVSSAGCVGLMQVQPRYHCPNGSARRCDSLNAGMTVAYNYMHRYGPVLGLSAFRSGHRNMRSSRSMHKAGERLEFSDYLVARAYNMCYNELDISSPYIEHGQYSNQRQSLGQELSANQNNTSEET